MALRGVERPVPASSIRMAEGGADGSLDPICGLPLSQDTAEEIAHDVRGSVVLFCSPGCVDTWRRRPPLPLRLSAADAAPRGGPVRELALNRPLRTADTGSTTDGRYPSSGMRESSEHHTPTSLASFRRSYVQIGVLTYSIGALAVVIYALATPGPHRLALVVLGSLSLVASVGPLRLLG